MRLVVGAALGAGVAVLAWLATRSMFAGPVFARRNYRGVSVPVGVGVLLAVSTLVVEALLTTADALHRGTPTDRSGRLSALVVIVGFALLGVIDDLSAQGDARGFAGHVRAMVHGQLTTGGLKLVGGGFVAVVVVGTTGPRDVGQLIVEAAVVALAANVANLFDRAPGRAIKVCFVAVVPVFALAGHVDRTQLTGVAIVVGAAIGLLAFDLREQLMLGDAGANALGAAVGLGFVATTGFTAHWVALAVLIGLNLASERVSFSQLIEAVPPIRALDQLGRHRRRTP